MNRWAFIGLLCDVVACGADRTVPSSESALLIENARVIDGLGGEPEEGLSLLIRDGRIAAIGRDVEAGGARRLDATGMTLLPGLIDAHVHLALVPGAGQRDDTPELTDLLLRHHLRGYLANGVTTVLEAGIPTETARKLIRWIDEGQPGPSILVLSPFLPAPAGYTTDPSIGITFLPVETPQDIEEQIQDSEGLPVIGLKVAVELETARDPTAWNFLAETFARGRLGPGATEEAVQETAAIIAALDWARDRLRRDQDAVRRMHEAGIPIVLGSDSGNWPIIPYEFHGPTTRREILLMEGAGLTRMEVIEAATRVAAEMLGIIREVGTVEVGKRADLLIVSGEPLEDLSALSEIAWTVQAGVARTPEEWMMGNIAK
jgi:imidazolonepropionase-like amidohydrolase